MVQCNVDYETVEVGDQITVWTDSGNSGQGGTVLAIDSKELRLAAPAAGRLSSTRPDRP